MNTFSSALAATSAPQGTIRLEAEDGSLIGTTFSTARPGYSGKGYVTGFDTDGDKVTFSFPAKAGLYTVRIRYCSPSAEKGYDLVVNGVRFSGRFAPTGKLFSLHSAGKVELRNGINSLILEKGWGYYDLDFIELSPAAIASYRRKPPRKLADPHATSQTKALFDLLIRYYGTRTLSGQYGKEEGEYIRSVSGKRPAILGADFMEYSPSRRTFGADPKQETEKAVQSAREGYIITMSWHWNAPSGLLNKKYTDKEGKTVEAQWYKGFYTNATTFDVQKALASPKSEGYRLLLRDIDVIAAELKKFAKANIPVLWRPLHEADGGWFWWGAKGPTACILLWRLMYDRLTHHHNLHNLIWVSSTGTKPDWYPGDAYVDIVGIDAYPSDNADPLSETWETLNRRFDGKKLLALTEFGGVPDTDKMSRYGVRWSYFVTWSGRAKKSPSSEVTDRYRQSSVLNQGESDRP
jgi:mannan endo-1,4-beta-mannosidase